MTLHFLTPALWGLVLVFSFIGYGALLRRLLFAREEVGWANEAAWGMAFVIALGGVLSYLYAFSAAVAVLLVLAGCALALADLFQSRATFPARFASLLASLRERPAAFALKTLGNGCIVALVTIQYLNDVVEKFLTLVSDDLKGYYIFADQLLELGGFAADPFNGMRLHNGLGAQSVLNALMLALFDFKNLYLIDGGVALIICVGLVLRIAKERRLAYPWRLALALFFLCVPFYPALRNNSSSLMTGMVMFLALFTFLDRDSISDETPVRNAFVVGLLASAACALKTNLIPPTVFVVALSYLWYLPAVRFKRRAVLEALLVPCLVFLLLLPWMLALLRSSGTMLYPILGVGFDEYRYGSYLFEDFAGGLSFGQKLSTIWARFFSRDIYLALLVLGAVGFAALRVRRRATMHAFALGTLLACIFILLKSDIGDSVPFYRYLFVCVFASLVVLLAALMEEVSRRVAPPKPATLRQYAGALLGDRVAAGAFLILLATAGVFFGYYQFAKPVGPRYQGRNLEMYQKYLAGISSEMWDEGGLIPEEDYLRYQRAQESVPPGEAILSRDDETILFHYGRNPIYDINDPGSCSPPPGLPYFQGPEAVASYLQTYRIRYVAYSYKDQAGYPVSENLWRLNPAEPYDHRVTERAKVALDRVLGELGATRKRIYDDGELFIIDLKTSAPVALEYHEPNYFQIGKILTPAWANTRGFDGNKVWTDGHGVLEGLFYQPGAEDDMLVLNTFGYHPWKGDLDRLHLVVSVNGVPLPGIAKNEKTYCYSLESVHQPITSISIDSATFVPRDEKVRFGKADDRLTLGMDVDTIEIANREKFFRQLKN